MCAQTDPSAKRQNLINLHMLALISVSLQISLSKLPVSSSIVHIPKSNSYISFSNNTRLFLTSVSSARLYAFFKTLLQHDTD